MFCVLMHTRGICTHINSFWDSYALAPVADAVPAGMVVAALPISTDESPCAGRPLEPLCD